MQTPVDSSHYGLAISTTSKIIEGKELKGHTGSAYGLYSHMFFHPKEKFGFVVITNGFAPDGPVGLQAIIRCLYDGLIKN